MKTKALFRVALGLLPCMTFAGITLAQDKQDQKGQPVEMGCVQWGRDVDAALAQSQETGKPVFLQFQEVPG